VSRSSDVIVVGAGLVGATVAYGMAELGYQVFLADRVDIAAVIDFSKYERPISINWSTRTLLQVLGLWEQLAADAVPITKVHVSVAQSFGSHVFRATQTPALGYILSFATLQQYLYQKVLAHPNIEFICWDKYEKFMQHDSTVQIDYLGKDAKVGSITAACCFAVDGTNSYIRENFLNITTDDSDTLSCLAADVVIDNLERGAYQRMSADGTLALIPTVGHNIYRLMWSMPERVAVQVKALDSDQMVCWANRLLGRRYGVIKSCSRHIFLELPWKIACSSYKERVLLLGNAAHTIYPAAAQGFNLGMQDISILFYLLITSDDEQDIAGCFAEYAAVASKLQRKRIAFVKTQHMFNQFSISQSLMAKMLVALDVVRPASNLIASAYMGTDIDAKYLDTLSQHLLQRQIVDVI
jgi:2-octaprenyl-6-methoxyphenol hydroxylase